MTRPLYATLLVAATTVGCGSSSEPAEQARSALRDVEPDLERLSVTVIAADASKRATLVEVRAAAARASQSLTDARRDLRDLSDASDADATARRELGDQVAALRDVQELSDSLSLATLSAPRIEAAFARAKLGVEDLSSSIDVPTIPADVLAKDLRDTRVAAAQRRGRARARRTPQVVTQPQTGQPSAPVGGSSSGAGTSFSYMTYRGPAFEARVPIGSGWGTPSDSEPTPGELFRTNLRGPNGLFVIIDYTPFENAKFGGSFRSRTVVGQTAFGSAVRYEFQGGRIAECQRQTCTDYIINGAGSAGFAVLAGGGAGSAGVARTVAESVVPTGG